MVPLTFTGGVSHTNFIIAVVEVCRHWKFVGILHVILFDFNHDVPCNHQGFLMSGLGENQPVEDFFSSPHDSTIADQYTVLFHSIRHPAWGVTGLPKLKFRQAPYLNVTFKYFWQVGCKFCVRRLKIVHFQLNYINYLHNAHKRDRWGSGFFSILNLFFQIFRWFWHFTKICITCVTFRRFWVLRDVLLPNWMK